MTRPVSRSNPPPDRLVLPSVPVEDPLDELPMPRRWLVHRVRGWVLRLGAFRSTALAAVAAALGSLAIVAAMNEVLPPPEGTKLMMLAFATAVPLIVAPPVAWLLVQLIFEAEAARRIAMRMAVTDPLTRAYNRRHFFRVGESALERTRIAGQDLSVLLLDVDHFKTVNDRHGHAAGDAVLQAVAQACMACLREHELFARFGGEEFAVLLPGTQLPDAAGIAERLRLMVEDLSIPATAGATIRPTVSIGVAASGTGSPSLDKLLAHADQAMYQAKRRGRNRVSTEAEPA